MRIYTLISFIFIQISLFGQNNKILKSVDTSNSKFYIRGDVIINCKNCKVDFCGNLINSDGDTLSTNNQPLYNQRTPFYITNNNILINKDLAAKLMTLNKVNSIEVFACNQARRIYGDIAKNQIYILELKDTSILSKPIFSFIYEKFKRKIDDINKVYINDLTTNINDIRLSNSAIIQCSFDKKKKVYQIKIE